MNFQNEISDPDECAKAADVTLPDRSFLGDPTYDLNTISSTEARLGSRKFTSWGSERMISSADSSMPVAGHRALNVDEGTYHRAEHDDSRRWLQYGRRLRNTQ